MIVIVFNIVNELLTPLSQFYSCFNFVHWYVAPLQYLIGGCLTLQDPQIRGFLGLDNSRGRFFEPIICFDTAISRDATFSSTPLLPTFYESVLADDDDDDDDGGKCSGKR